MTRTSQRRNLVFLSLLGFLVSMGFGLIIPIMPYYVVLLGGDALALGILLSSFMATRALLARFFGRLSDRAGRKRIILAGALLYALLGYLFTLPNLWEALILVRGLQGVASAMVWPVGEALVVDSAPEERRGLSMSIYILASNIGFAAGPFAGGLLFWTGGNLLGLSEIDNFHFPFYFIALLSLVAAILTQVFVRDVGRPDKNGRLEDEQSTVTLPKELRSQVNILFVNNLGNGFSFSLIGSLPVFYMMDFLSLDEWMAGVVLGVAMTAGLLVNVPAGHLSDRFGRKSLVVYGSYVARTSSAFIPFTASVYQIAGLMITRAFSFQASQPALRALQADLFPQRIRGNLIGTSQMLFNTGAVFGAPLGGYLYDLFKGTLSLPLIGIPGVALPFLISALLGIVTTTLVLLFIRETRGVPAGEPSLPPEAEGGMP